MALALHTDASRPHENGAAFGRRATEDRRSALRIHAENRRLARPGPARCPLTAPLSPDVRTGIRAERRVDVDSRSPELRERAVFRVVWRASRLRRGEQPRARLNVVRSRRERGNYSADQLQCVGGQRHRSGSNPSVSAISPRVDVALRRLSAVSLLLHACGSVSDVGTAWAKKSRSMRRSAARSDLPGAGWDVRRPRLGHPRYQ